MSKKKKQSNSQDLIVTSSGVAANKIDSDNNIIYIYDSIDGFLALEINSFLDSLKNYNGDLNVKINSFGGYMDSAQSIISDFANFGGRIITDITGVAYSAAAMISLLGDYRKISRVSSFMLHYPLWATDAQSLHTHELDVKVTREMTERLMELALSGSKITVAKFRKMCANKDWYLTPQECKRLQVVHEVY